MALHNETLDKEKVLTHTLTLTERRNWRDWQIHDKERDKGRKGKEILEIVFFSLQKKVSTGAPCS